MTPESTPEILSLAEANAALPNVAQLIAHLQALQRAMADGQTLHEELTKQLSWGNGSARTAVQDQLSAGTARQDQVMADAEATFTQLHVAGAMLKDLESGLVDFYGERDGDIILLCWRQGEALRIEHWHTLEGGFAGRQPVDALVT